MSAKGLYRIRWRRIVLTRVHRTRRVSVCEILTKYYGNVEQGRGWKTSANGLHGNDECFSSYGFRNDAYFIVLVVYLHCT